MEVLKINSLAKDMNDLTFTDYYYRLMLLARSTFEWCNLPNGIDEKWIERYLYTEGKCMFFKDPKYGYMVAKCTPNGELNFYDEPTRLRPYGTNYTGKSYQNNKECVLIRNNDDMIPTSYTIKLFAKRLTEIDRTIDVNIMAQKTPVIVKCTQQQRLTLKNLFKQFLGNEPLIWGDKDLDLNNTQVLDLNPPLVFDKLQIQKHAVWNEVMTFLGVNNANMDKRERLVDDEVQANNEQIELSANIMLKSREQACKQINSIFGTDISVKRRKLKIEDFEANNDEKEPEEGDKVG